MFWFPYSKYNRKLGLWTLNAVFHQWNKNEKLRNVKRRKHTHRRSSRWGSSFWNECTQGTCNYVSCTWMQTWSRQIFYHESLCFCLFGLNVLAIFPRCTDWKSSYTFIWRFIVRDTHRHRLMQRIIILLCRKVVRRAAVNVSSIWWTPGHCRWGTQC